VIVVSQAVARGLLDDGLPARRLLLVHDGVVDRRPEGGGHEALQELGVPPGSPVIGNVAAVATQTGGIPEAVAHGTTGVLVPVGDPSALAAALTRLLLSPGEREAMGRQGRRRFERLFKADRMVDGTLRSYDSLRHA